MAFRLVCVFVLLLLLSLSILSYSSSIGSASQPSVTVLQPYNATMFKNGSIYLGKVGPGQTFYVTISAATANYTGFQLSQGWNQFVVTNLPQYWIASNSSLNNPVLSVRITVGPNAANGQYGFNLTAINIGNYSRGLLGKLKFTAYVNVTPDVFKLDVSPTSISVGPGQPASVYVTINNTGVSDSPFLITVHNLPAWNTSSTVIALHRTTQQFVYPIYENTPGVYNITLYVSSVASPLIYKQSPIRFVTVASVLNDYSAIGEGAPTFPIIYEPVYAIMYLISLLFKH